MGGGDQHIEKAVIVRIKDRDAMTGTSLIQANFCGNVYEMEPDRPLPQEPWERPEEGPVEVRGGEGGPA